MADRKKSPIWSFFSVTEDSKFAKCNICKQAISHGGKTMKTLYIQLGKPFEVQTYIRVWWISGAKKQKQAVEHDSYYEPQWSKAVDSGWKVR